MASRALALLRLAAMNMPASLMASRSRCAVATASGGPITPAAMVDWRRSTTRCNERPPSSSRYRAQPSTARASVKIIGCTARGAWQLIEERADAHFESCPGSFHLEPVCRRGQQLRGRRRRTGCHELVFVGEVVVRTPRVTRAALTACSLRIAVYPCSADSSRAASTNASRVAAVCSSLRFYTPTCRACR